METAGDSEGVTDLGDQALHKLRVRVVDHELLGVPAHRRSPPNVHIAAQARTATVSSLAIITNATGRQLIASAEVHFKKRTNSIQNTVYYKYT